MSNYYLDFVGLNTLIYESCGYDVKNQTHVYPITGSPTASYTLRQVEKQRSNHFVAQNYMGALENPPVEQNIRIYGGVDNEELVYSLDLPAYPEYIWARASLERYKNHSFSHELPSTASFFNALMIHRNGPYGWPGFKGIKNGENPLIRKQRKNNLFTILKNPQNIVVRMDGLRSVLPLKYAGIRLFDEPSVVSCYKPFEADLGKISIRKGRTLDIPKEILKNLPSKKFSSVKEAAMKSGLTIERHTMYATLGNEINYFTNDEVNVIAEVEEPERSDDYEDLTSMYLDGGLDSYKSPFNIFGHCSFSQTIYPPEKYTYKSYTRQRTNFSFNWRDNATDRSQHWLVPGFSQLNCIPPLKRSIWPLDVDPNWHTADWRQTLGDETYPELGNNHKQIGETPHYLGRYLGFTTGSRWTNLGSLTNSKYKYFNTASFGTLWNPYSQFYENLQKYIQEEYHQHYHHLRTYNPDTDTWNATQNSFHHDTSIYLRPAALYSRRHCQTTTGSISNPSGMFELSQRLSGNVIPRYYNFQGEAAWDAPLARGRGPFTDNYDITAKDIRNLGKDHTIIPEFTISDFVPFYMSNSVGASNYRFLNINGGRSTTKEFYEVYSNTDFLKNFDVVLEDHEDLVEPSQIKLSCNIISKFVPYDGFYPVQRSVELAQQFYKSYRNNTKLSAHLIPTGSDFFGNEIELNVTSLSQPISR